jgi:hypothetical protein
VISRFDVNAGSGSESIPCGRALRRAWNNTK